MDAKLTMGLNSDDIYEYLARCNDLKAERQAITQPLRQALQLFKFIYGYTSGHTIQHDHEAYGLWKQIVHKVYKHYSIFDKTDVDPTKLAEMNLYAINLIKEETRTRFSAT